MTCGSRPYSSRILLNVGCLSENTKEAVSLGDMPSLARDLDRLSRNSRVGAHSVPDISFSEPRCAPSRSNFKNSADSCLSSDSFRFLLRTVASCISIQRPRISPSYFFRNSGIRDAIELASIDRYLRRQ